MQNHESRKHLGRNQISATLEIKILTAVPDTYIILYSSAKIIYNTLKVFKISKALLNPLR